MIDNISWGGVEWNSRKPCVFIQESTEEWGLQSVVDGDKLRTILKTWSKCSMMPSTLQWLPCPSHLLSVQFSSQLAGYAVTSLSCARGSSRTDAVPICKTLETSCNALHEGKECPWAPTGFQHADPETQTMKRGNRTGWSGRKETEWKTSLPFSILYFQTAQGWRQKQVPGQNSELLK